MSLTVRPLALTRAEYESVTRVVTTAPSVPREGSSATLAEISRADSSRIFVEARRMTGGAMRYFLRDETLRDAAEAAGSDVAPLDIGEERVVTVSYGDADGDGHNDILFRTADSPDDDDTEDQFYVITSSGDPGEIVPVQDAPEEQTARYDSEPPPSPARPLGGGTAASAPAPRPPEGSRAVYAAGISPSAKDGI